MKLMKAVRQFAFPIFMVALLLLAHGSAQAQSTDVQFFPETGHSVKGLFLHFYKAAKDPLLYFGYPITEQMVSKDGKAVQYFQRSRFELSSGQSIQLTPLGSLTYKPKGPWTIDNPNACERYPTGYSVCLSFLEFYKANGGSKQFGNPISPFDSSDNLIVQYFENTRFEWRGDRQTVVISDLGRIYFDQLKEDPAQLKPIDQPDATINPVLSIKVRAFVLKAVTLQNGQQTVYIVVQNQTSKPVPGAIGKVLVKFTDGTSQEYAFATNSLGIAQITFNFKDQKSGELVPIEVAVNYQSLNSTTKTSFRIWY
jgi:hypothetical protein